MDSATALDIRAPALRGNWRITPARLAAGLVLFALGMRVIGLGSRPLWLDEAYSAWFSARSWHELWTSVPTYEPHPPFYYSLLKLWRDVAGGDALALRAFSVLFGVLAVPVVIAAAFEQERQDPGGRPLLRAGLAGFLTACSPMLIFLDQEARPYPLLVFAYAVAVLGLLRLMREFSEGRVGKWPSWAMLGVGTEVALWAHGLGLLYAWCLFLALLPAWLRAPRDRSRIVRGIVVATLVVLLYAPCLSMILSRSGDWGTGWLRWEPIMPLQLFGLYSVPFDALTVASAVAALAMLLLVKRALQGAMQAGGWSADRAIVLLWLGPPLLAVAISATVLPVFLPRTLAATLVPAYLAMGTALAKTPSPRERAGLAVVIAIMLAPSAVQIGLRPSLEKWDQVNAYLARHVGPRDQVWLYPNDSALTLAAAARRAPLSYATRAIPAPYPAVGFKGLSRAGSPAVVSVTKAQAAAIAGDPALRNIPTIWLLTRQIGLFDPNDDFASALGRNRRPGAQLNWGYIRLQPYYVKTAQ